MPRRRGQKGRVFKRGKKWVGSYRDYETDPITGRRTRHTVTFPESVTSERAAWTELGKLLQPYNEMAEKMLPSKPKASGKRLSELVDEWKEKILPNLKDGTQRTALSHIRTYINPILGEMPLRELTVKEHQAFVTAVGRHVDRRKTATMSTGLLLRSSVAAENGATQYRK